MLQNNMYHVWAFEAHTAELFETGVWGFEDLLFCPKACYVLWHKETAFIQGVMMVTANGRCLWCIMQGIRIKLVETASLLPRGCQHSTSFHTRGMYTTTIDSSNDNRQICQSNIVEISAARW